MFWLRLEDANKTHALILLNIEPLPVALNFRHQEINEEVKALLKNNGYYSSQVKHSLLRVSQEGLKKEEEQTERKASTYDCFFGLFVGVF